MVYALCDLTSDEIAIMAGLDTDVDMAAGFCYISLNSGQPERRSSEMKILSLSEAKMKLSSLVDSVHKTDEEVVITKNGSPAAVLISPDEFEGWKETIAIRSDSAFMDEIKKGVDALKKGKAKLYTLEELFR